MVRRPFFAWTVLALSTAACSSSSSGSALSDSTPAGSDGRGMAGRATSVRFDDPALASDPGSIQPVTIHVEPPGKYAVRVALVGSALDASLDKSDTETDDGGGATI